MVSPFCYGNHACSKGRPRSPPTGKIARGFAQGSQRGADRGLIWPRLWAKRPSCRAEPKTRAKARCLSEPQHRRSSFAVRQTKQRGERTDKPGSVLGRPFISNASRPASLARNPSARRATVWRSYLRLLQMGFAKPRRCRRAGALLPHRFSFSPVSARRSACSRGSLLFCGTFRRVAPPSR